MAFLPYISMLPPPILSTQKAGNKEKKPTVTEHLTNHLFSVVFAASYTLLKHRAPWYIVLIIADI